VTPVKLPTKGSPSTTADDRSESDCWKSDLVRAGVFDAVAGKLICSSKNRVVSVAMHHSVGPEPSEAVCRRPQAGIDPPLRRCKPPSGRMQQVMFPSSCNTLTCRSFIWLLASVLRHKCFMSLLGDACLMHETTYCPLVRLPSLTLIVRAGGTRCYMATTSVNHQRVADRTSGCQS